MKKEDLIKRLKEEGEITLYKEGYLEEVFLGKVSYGAYGGKYQFPVNVLKLSGEDTIVGANDFFNLKGVSNFNSKHDGLSIGYRVDKWGSGDHVDYTERPLTDEEVKNLDLEHSYLRSTEESKVNETLDKLFDSEEIDPATLHSAVTAMANFFHQVHSGKKIQDEDFDYSIFLLKDSLGPYFKTDKVTPDTLKITHSQGNDQCEVYLTEDGVEGARIDLEELDFEHLEELIDLIIEETFYGPNV